MKHDIVLIQKYGNLGITKKDVDFIFKNLNQDEAFPIDFSLQDYEISLIGYISKTAMDALAYDCSFILSKLAKTLDVDALEEKTLINDMSILVVKNI